MNYMNHYIKLVRRAFHSKRRKVVDKYYERHHVKPKCFGGTRLVLLTAKEHYIAHFLLYKHYKKHGNKNQKIKMSHAFAAMAMSNNNMHRETSRSFELCRKARSKAMSGANNHNYRKKIRRAPHTDEERKQKSEYMKKNNPAFNFTDEWRKNQSKSKIGKPSNAKGKFKQPGDGKWEGTAHEGKDNPMAKVIFIFNDLNNVIFKCNGTFYKTLKENDMPVSYFRKTLIDGPYKPKFKDLGKYEGWYAKEMKDAD